MSWHLLAAAAANGYPSISDLLNASTSAGFGALAWWLIVKALPRLIDAFRDDIRQQREQFDAALAEERKSREAAQDKYMTSLQLLVDAAKPRAGRDPIHKRE